MSSSPAKRRRRSKAGHRIPVRFLHPDILEQTSGKAEELGFDSFSAYADFVFALVHGKWQELGFKNASAARRYMADLGRGVFRRPPDRALQMGWLLTEDTAA
ncbi:hypothetical protein OG339_48280 (plasmid) [Streptosporangium sp. NBC_01495]|uniref:hypothetical protein n=1 Tax=Streptosporangium sp. NBC_01495 TaxID=2903899 RepID=UPI002E303735|nr:hypothetical protein [Streptosporangium sp. NBC_01495]